MNAILPPLDMALMAISAHLLNLCYAVFCKFMGDFWLCLGGNSFYQRIVKLREIRNIEDLVKF